jgi:integrase
MAPAHKVLTEKVVAALKPGEERAHYYDTKTPHFGVRVEPSGRKAYVWYAKVNGQPRFRACGEYPVTTLSEARTKAEEWTGIASAWKLAKFAPPDPFEKTKAAPVAPRGVPSFTDLLEAYIAGPVRSDLSKPAKSEAARILRAEKIERAEKNARWMAQKYFSAWNSLPIDTIGIDHVLAVKRSLSGKIYAANRAIEFIRAMFAWAGAKPDGRVNFAPVVNPAKDVELFEGEVEREVFMNGAELLRFNAALDKEPSADFRDFLILLINTAVRKGNLYAMRWDGVDWDSEKWTVPYSKNQESYAVKLLPAAMAVLKRRRKAAPTDAVYVFAGVGATGHVTDYSKLWYAFRTRAGLEHIRLHDLRRTAGSYIYAACKDLKATGAALGHRSLDSTMIYARLLDEVADDARQSGQDRMVAEMRKSKRRQKALQPRKVSRAALSA